MARGRLGNAFVSETAVQAPLYGHWGQMSAILAVPLPTAVMATAGPGARTVADRPSALTSRDQPCPASIWGGRSLLRLSAMALPILRTGLACALVHVTGLGCPTSHCHSGARRQFWRVNIPPTSFPATAIRSSA